MLRMRSIQTHSPLYLFVELKSTTRLWLGGNFANHIFCYSQVVFCVFFLSVIPLIYFSLFFAFLLSLPLTHSFLFPCFSSISPCFCFFVTHLPLTFVSICPLSQPLSFTLNPTCHFLSPSSSSLPPGHSHPMDMPGRGLYDERDSGIARSGRLMRLGAKAWIDLHSTQLSALQLNMNWDHIYSCQDQRSQWT